MLTDDIKCDNLSLVPKKHKGGVFMSASKGKMENWNVTEPPKSETKPIKLRYKDPQGKVHQGSFVWSKMERTWVEVTMGESIGLYEDDGYKVIGWKG